LKQLNNKNIGRFESINIITIEETNGIENKGLRSDKPKMIIKEHWNRKNLVIVEIDNIKHTVDANELKSAIDNAQNAHGY